MVDKRIIVSRIEAIEKHLARINSCVQKPNTEFLSDLDAQDIAEYNLFQIVNHLIDVIQHVVVDENLGFPQSAYDAADILHKQGILPEDECETLRKMIGFRNIVGHDYISMDKNIVYDIATEGIRDIKKIIASIVSKYL
jgi:uncharacterized protein YutE (UPF0331/DUF86 family)